MNIAPNERVSGSVGGLFWLNRTDSGFSGLFGRDRSDPAAHAKLYVQFLLNTYQVLSSGEVNLSSP